MQKPHADSPLKVVAEFLATLGRKNFFAALTYLDEESIAAFHDEWIDPIRGGLSSRPKPSGESVEGVHEQSTFFASVESEERLLELSPGEFLVEFWRDQSSRAPDTFSGVALATLLGEVREGDDRAYVLYRHGVDVGTWIRVSLIPLAKRASVWRILINEGLAMPSSVSARAV
jgi:hypothetical protein